MKKQVSVFGLHARAALNRLLPVVLGLLVVEGIFACDIKYFLEVFYEKSLSHCLVIALGF